MKKMVVLAGLVFLLASYAQAAELVGYWNFDEGKGKVVKDSAGNHNGEINGAAWVKGKKGGALEFDGKSYVEIKDTTKSCFDITSMTLSAWIYPKASSERLQGIVGKRWYAGSTYGISLDTKGRLQFKVYGPFSKTGKKYDSFYYRGKTIFNLDQWNHVAVTYDGITVRFYVNGRLDSVYEENRLPWIDNQSILIGVISTRKGAHKSYFTGIIDEVKIYKGALTEEEIETEYQESGGETFVSFFSIPQIAAAEKIPKLAPVSKAEVKLQNICLRGVNTLFIDVKEGENIEVEIISKQLGARKSLLIYRLVDPDGKEIKKGQVQPGKTVNIFESAEKIGAYQLTVSTGGNACYVKVANRYVMIKTPIHVLGTRMKGYFYVPKHVKKFKVKIEGSGEEHVGIVIYDNKDSQIIKGDTTYLSDLEVIVPEGGADSIWQFQMYKVANHVYDDAYLAGFSFEIPPYIFTNKRSYFPREVEAPPLVHSYFTRDYYTREKTAELKGRINIAGDLPSHLTASLLIKKDGKVVIKKKDISISGKDFIIKTDITSLLPGNYQSLLSVYRQKKLIFSENIPLVKYRPAPCEIKVDRENLYPLVNDKPFFPIGIFDIPENKIAEYSKAGFNLTRAPVSDNYLDTAYYNGMQVQAATFYCMPRFSTKPLDEIERIIRKSYLPNLSRRCKNHPAFGGYFWDEPAEKEAAAAAILHKVTKEYDPYHPVCPCFYSSKGPTLSPDCYDIGMGDIYWYNATLTKSCNFWTTMDKYANIFKKNRKPFWFIPEAAGWHAYTAITPAQQRLQTYLALIYEAKGIYYWSYPQIFPAMRKMLKKLAGEIRELSPALLYPSPEQVISGKKTGIHLLVKEHEKKTYLISANNSRDIQKTIRIILPNVKKNTSAKVLFEDRVIPVKEGVLIDEFAPYATHVYEIKGLFTDIDKPFEVNLEMVASRTIPQDKTRRWPDWGDPTGGVLTLTEIGNPGFEDEEHGQPRIWTSSCS
ncbi:LamG domain-containing protein, partial [bacterium]|nr:LamG domain-containing protein [bacterium]